MLLCCCNMYVLVLLSIDMLVLTAPLLTYICCVDLPSAC